MLNKRQSSNFGRVEAQYSRRKPLYLKNY